MRRAVSARRDVAEDTGTAGGSRGASDPAPGELTDAGAADTSGDVPEGPTSATARPSTRPADAARDALRAARSEREAQAQQAREDIGTTGVEPTPRSAYRTASTSPRPTMRRHQAAQSRRPRELGELLGNAFQSPPSADPTHEHPAAPDDSQPTTPPAPPQDAPPGDTTSHPASPATPPTSPSTPYGTTTPHPASPSMPSEGSASPAATPHVPRSMASPRRDGDLRRTFPAFPPRPSDDDAPFAESWWGNAWISALERGALDVKRLARGRGYAQQGHVDAITVTPGLVLAYVRGSRPRPYRVQVRLRTLDDADWERFLDAAADRPGHIAALLDKEMPHALAEGTVPLLPGPGDLEPHCSCPDRGHPCKHAAALCYQTARLLDADPFVLLLLRGRGERALLDALSRRNATRAARAAQEREPAPLPGVRATDALARQRELPPLPRPLPAPAHPEQPPVHPAAPGGPDPFALDQLATDAAARAHAFLVTGRDPVAELTLWQDAVRLAAGRPGSGLTAGTRALYSSLAAAVGRTPAELARAVAAWRQGGLDGLAVLEEPWDPPAGRFDRARPLLLAADLPAFRPWRNRLTHPGGHVQLRLGRDALWYAYESEPGRDDWWPRGTPDPDPVGALTGLGAGDEL
ncbi:SWIM zinc finger family protein [Streptomyces chromofuscus]|uniref:SWIM zinc finger family protein n=1 Tax=Streptomyces chromofuscus TaxID=42881 RepID=UPI001D15DC8D|nr:SWIM zinc finger family protein [Streptomyces chromofuscus]